jgi:hypothetical protein
MFPATRRPPTRERYRCARQPFDEIDHYLVAPHPSREAAKVAERFDGIGIVAQQRAHHHVGAIGVLRQFSPQTGSGLSAIAKSSHFSNSRFFVCRSVAGSYRPSRALDRRAISWVSAWP